MGSSIANRGFQVKAIFSLIVLAAIATALVFPLTEHNALAQAPTGPQPGAQPQQNPAPAKTPDAPQKPPEAGVAIAVDVPIVTLDVVATTQHGDIIPGLKRKTSASSTTARPRPSPSSVPPMLPSPWFFSSNSAAAVMAVSSPTWGSIGPRRCSPRCCKRTGSRSRPLT